MKSRKPAAKNSILNRLRAALLCDHARGGFIHLSAADEGTAAQIDTLAQRLSEASTEPSASAKKAGDAFARLLAARIGSERAALAFSSSMTADIFEQAEALLTLVLDYG